MPEMTKEEIENRDAHVAVMAVRQLEGLKLLSYDERESINRKLMAKYGEYLSPLRTFK